MSVWDRMADGRDGTDPFDHFPWFRHATTAQMSDIQRPSAGHLHWPELDVDLSLESIENPSAFSWRKRGDASLTTSRSLYSDPLGRS